MESAQNERLEVGSGTILNLADSESPQFSTNFKNRAKIGLLSIMDQPSFDGQSKFF
jgi:hypothetical protein